MYPAPKTYDLSRLRAPKSPDEFLKLLREISENFLLLNPEFQSAENLMRLFGPGSMLTNNGEQDSDWYHTTILMIDETSIIKPWVGEKLIFSYATYPNDGKKSASLYMHNLNINSPINAQLLEKILVFGIVGQDPLYDWSVLTNEALSAAASRLQPTHRKGYYAYKELFKKDGSQGKTDLDLHGNGSIFRLTIDQKENYYGIER